jgi:hypothetical protein
VAETTSCAGDDDPVSGFCVGLAESRVDGYACAE